MPTRDLVPVTGWTNRNLRLKERMKAIKAKDHRMTESRIVEDAVIEYLPKLEQKFFNNELDDRPLPQQNYLNKETQTKGSKQLQVHFNPDIQHQQGGPLIADALVKLVALMQQGLLNDKEFKKLKNKLLS
jgi:hypothetical protein